MSESKQKAPPYIDPKDIKMPTAVIDPNAPNTSRWLLIALVFVLVAILIGLIAWVVLLEQAKPPVLPNAERPTAEENNEPESTTAEAAVETLGAMSPSTELSSIEADLNATTITDLDGDFADIDAMLNATE